MSNLRSQRDLGRNSLDTRHLSHVFFSKTFAQLHSQIFTLISPLLICFFPISSKNTYFNFSSFIKYFSLYFCINNISIILWREKSPWVKQLRKLVEKSEKCANSGVVNLIDYQLWQFSESKRNIFAPFNTSSQLWFPWKQISLFHKFSIFILIYISLVLLEIDCDFDRYRKKVPFKWHILLW